MNTKSFHELPPELWLHISTYLFVQDLRTLHLLSREWHKFMTEHAEFIYRNAAYRHHFIDSVEAPLSDAKLYRMHSARAVAEGWKSYCAFRYQLESSWEGYGPSVAKFLPETVRLGSSLAFGVHRFKVDEEAGFVITTHMFGGLTVLDLRNIDQALWSLPTDYVRSYAHIEYDCGFMVFDRVNGHKEVWRHVVDYDPSNIPQHNLPDESQREAAEATFSDGDRGRFVPWALLRMPEFTRAYRFVFPTLLVAGYQRAFLFDIPSATLIQKIEIIRPEEDPGDLHYVELSRDHVFVCFVNEVRVFDRHNHGRLVLSIPVTGLSARSPVLAIQAGSPRQSRWGVRRRLQRERLGPVQMSGRWRLAVRGTEFNAVHVSPCGKHLAILMSDNRLLLIEKFQRMIFGGAKLEDIGTDICFGSITFDSSCYLAFYDDKVGVVTHSGIFVVTLDSARRGVEGPWRGPGSLEGTGRSFPNMAVTSVHGFDDALTLRDVSCLQLTRTGIFFPYKYFRARRSSIPSPRSPTFSFGQQDDETDTASDALSDISEDEPGVNLGLNGEFMQPEDRANVVQALVTARLCCIDLSAP